MAAAADSKSAVREYVRVRVPPLAPMLEQVIVRLERCPSGRWCNLGKVVWGQLHRGFESPPLRHFALRYEVRIFFSEILVKWVRVLQNQLSKR